MIALAVFVLGFSQKQIATNPIILDGVESRYASEYIIMTTPLGIYNFARSSKTWKSITTAHGLPADEVYIAGLDQGIIWVATERGIASADIRLNDWIKYDIPGRVSGLSFDESYVWVAGDFGLKRFDKYAEIWEDIDETPAEDVLFDQTFLWIATARGILRYNPEFERIEEMQAAPKHEYYYIIETKSMIWFLAEDNFVAYDKTTEAWTEYASLEVDDYAVLDDSLFVVSNKQVLLYNPTTDNWGAMIEAEGFGGVNGISINSRMSNKISFATDEGLLLYDLAEKTQVAYNRTGGMFSDTVSDVYEAPGYLFAIGPGNIQYYDKSTGIWQVEKLTPVTGINAKIVNYDEAGLHLNAIDDIDIRLQGRAYYSVSGVMKDSLDWSDYSTINLRLIGLHTSGRMISVYYDDTNKEDTLYGFGYRGLENDFLYRANGGFIESEYYEFNLVPEFSTFGANARLRHRAHSLMLQGGQLKSSQQNDFFYGRSFERDTTLRDIDYSRNTFYRIPQGNNVTREGADTVFVDDGLEGTNTIATRTGYTIAGITGDFDVLMNGFDYFIDYQRGILQLLRPVGDDFVVVLKADAQEIVIQSGVLHDNVIVNVYALGPNIVPGSLELGISDTLGITRPLSEFGIDNDNDGVVDADFISYRLGYLIFPQDRPFPDEVYDQQLHVYTIEYNFLTQSVFYSLSRQPVAIGSEKVFVDGEQMTRNYHYSIDYTSGTVLFLSDDVVSDFSEVEIQYVAIERTRTDLFYSVQPNIKIGDNINVAPGYSTIDEENIFHVSGKYQQGSANNSIMVVPQFAVNEEKEYAHDYLLVANYRAVTLNANYRGFTDGFEAFGLSEKRYGDLEHSGAVSLGIEPMDYVRLNTSMKKEWLADTLGDSNETEFVSGRIEYLNPNLPNGFLLAARNKLPNYEKTRLQCNTNYSFQMAENKVRMTSSFYNDLLDFTDDSRKKIIGYTVNTNLSFSFPLRLDIYTHGADRYAEGSREKDENEIRLALNFEAIPGLYYTGNYQQRKETYFLLSSKEISIRNYFYNELNIAPGRWYSPLSMVNLTLGNGQNFEENLGKVPLSRELPLFLFGPVEDDIATLSDFRNTYAKIYFKPLSNLNLQLKRTVNRSGTARYDIPILRHGHADEIRAEYEQAQIGLVTVALNRTENRFYPLQVTTNVYLEWIRSWTAQLRTKFAANHRADEDDYQTAQAKSTESTVRMETLWRFGQRSYVNVSLGARRQDRLATGISNSILPGCSVYLNMIEFLYMQFDYEANVLIHGETTHSLSAKITGSL